ncbi:hypothetical protein RFI_28879, partial [Reticulomyxa filosa]
MSYRDIPSPPRLPCVHLRSYETTTHVEFYKPIPIGELRSTQFVIKNDTYDQKSVRLETIACQKAGISIHPSAVNLKRYETALITVVCKPMEAKRIVESLRIQWDYHSVEVKIHAVGYYRKEDVGLVTPKTNTHTHNHNHTHTNPNIDTNGTDTFGQKRTRQQMKDSDCKSPLKERFHLLLY